MTIFKTFKQVPLIEKFLFLALFLFCFSWINGCNLAFADVRGSDIIAGQSVDSRGITYDKSPDVACEYAAVMDVDGSVYFEREADAPTQIASITKVMTAATVLDLVSEGMLSLSDIVSVSEYAASIGESSASLQPGDSLTVEAALYGLLVPSGNDAAQVLAESFGAKLLASGIPLYKDDGETPITNPSEAFVEQMNQTAESIHCTDTVFENAHGLDSDEFAGDQHSTAHDVALICAYAMQKDLIRTIVFGGDTTITVYREGQSLDIELLSTDELIGVYPYAIGIKTGYTSLAGPCFAGAASKNGFEIYAIVLDSSTESQRFVDTQTLCDWTFQHVDFYSLVNSSSVTTMDKDGISQEVPLIAQVAHSEWADVTIPATFADLEASATILDLNGPVTQYLNSFEISGDVSVGDTVGTVTFKQRNKAFATIDLIATQDVASPNPLQKIIVWFQRVFRSLIGDSPTVTSQLFNDPPLISD